jgi:hypothetical protein
LLGTLRVMLAALPLLAGSAVAAAERDDELAHRFEAVVRVHAEILPEARTAAYLGGGPRRLGDRDRRGDAAAPLGGVNLQESDGALVVRSSRCST